MTLRELSRLSVVAILFCFKGGRGTLPVFDKGNYDCAKMKECIDHIWNGPSGIYFYRNLTSYPKSSTIWMRYYVHACRARTITYHCAKRSYPYCKENHLRVELKVAKRMIKFICKGDGLEYLWRIYNEEKHCIANATVTAILRSDKQKCNAAGYDLVTAAYQENYCRLLKNSWDCEMASAEKHCSHLSEWLTYHYWKDIVEIGYERCIFDLKQDRVPFPRKSYVIPSTPIPWEEYFELLKNQALRLPFVKDIDHPTDWRKMFLF
ncbi:hypothetical protein PoB_002117900 [Plakobranchus ocellatus]|uniref:Uncharacterized protein n=1 Tax=Plakobranchus ocellatus TaxID=259542 RepID=A0AAV3ZLC3_9GAST|nr:hypothetical protein PoB_002117900 [Plakobranchus ocellatus]